MIQLLTLLFLVLGITADNLPAQSGEKGLELSLDPRTPHRFVFSNKRAAFWFGETQRFNQGGFQGYTILESRYLEDYFLELDGQPLHRSTAREIRLYPDRLERRYPAGTETFFFVDSLNLLLVRFVPHRKVELGLRWRLSDPLRQLPFTGGERKGRLRAYFRGFGKGKPPYLVTGVDGVYRMRRTFTPPTADGTVGFRVESADTLWFWFALADSRKQWQEISRKLADKPALLDLRRRRIARLLTDNRLVTGREDLDRAYRWALISLDDLLTHQRGAGIWAGLPWFNNYWGRDSFISFRGALLCSGQFHLAREILRSFARFQNRDSTSRYYGRIPNRVTLEEVIYNTADGTPWFVKACEDYVRYSGDLDFRQELFPVIRRAIAGSIRHHLDEYGLLTHGEAETWMDAVGTGGPWSPRGNRAVEVQVLWMESLRIASHWAQELGENDLARRWGNLLKQARENFLRYFWNPDRQDLFDHLNPDGTPDLKIRPNQVFALTVPEFPLLNQRQQRSVLREVTEKLTYPWGVGSLWQGDPDFHPYHHYLPYYVPDAAYHNGVVWTWLAGPLLTALLPVHPERAFQLLESEARQILYQDAVGSFSELLDAWPQPGENFPRVSGTVSQAWSLAEFLRNVREDLLGIRPDLPEHRLSLQPNLPPELSVVTFSFRVGETLFRAEYRLSDEEGKVLLRADRSLKRPLHLDFRWPLGDQFVYWSVKWSGKEPLQAVLRRRGGRVTVQIGETLWQNFRVTERPSPPEWRFCQPAMDFSLPVLQNPGYELLSPAEVQRSPGREAHLLFDVTDPAGDDRGPDGRYTYPTHPAFQAGIFDGRRVQVWADRDYYYFRFEYRNLVNPGWHPEPGYQLTFTAVALVFDDVSEPRTRVVGRGAHYRVPPEFTFQRILYIGNGFQIVDGTGKVLAEFRPADPSQAIGSVADKTVRFAVPKKYFPAARLLRALVMIGGQDDHGAGGLGDFRQVGRKASRWQGGGAEQDQGNPAVYDIIEIR